MESAFNRAKISYKKITRNSFMAKFYYGGLKAKMLFVSPISKSFPRDLRNMIVI